MGRKKKLTEIKVGNVYENKFKETVFVVKIHEQVTTESYIFSEQVEYYFLINPNDVYMDSLGNAQYSWTKL